jgi:hypothetical protein
VNTLQNWRVIGSGPAFVKLGHLVRYRVDAVISWATGAEVAAC